MQLAPAAAHPIGVEECPRYVRLVLGGLLAALLAVFLVGAPAQAAPRSPDPELVRPSAPVSRASAAKVAPAGIDSDVYAYTISPTYKTYFVAAGHLALTLASGSTTKYQGTFVDYVGAKAYKASADASNTATPTLKLETKNGKFTFRTDAGFGGTFYSGTATSKPSKLKVPTSQVFFSAVKHSVTSVSYAITLTERSGAIANPFEYDGTMTIVFDGNGRISGGQVTVTDSRGRTITHGLSASGYYSTVYFYTVAKVDKKYFGLSATLSGGTFSGNGFLADGSKTSQWSFGGTA